MVETFPPISVNLMAFIWEKKMGKIALKILLKSMVEPSKDLHRRKKNVFFKFHSLTAFIWIKMSNIALQNYLN